MFLVYALFEQLDHRCVEHPPTQLEGRCVKLALEVSLPASINVTPACLGLWDRSTSTCNSLPFSLSSKPSRKFSCTCTDSQSLHIWK